MTTDTLDMRAARIVSPLGYALVGASHGTTCFRKTVGGPKGLIVSISADVGTTVHAPPDDAVWQAEGSAPGVGVETVMSTGVNLTLADALAAAERFVARAEEHRSRVGFQ
jgi:hypothetical protein